MYMFYRGKDLYWPTQSIYDFIINEVKSEKMPLKLGDTEEKDSNLENPIKSTNEYWKLYNLDSEYVDLLMETNRYFSEIIAEAKINGFDQFNSIPNSIINILFVLLK